MEIGPVRLRGSSLWGASLRPGMRGSLFYLGYWGVIAIFWPFVNVYFVEQGLSGREIGVLAALFPAMTLIAAPPLAALGDRRRWSVPILVVGLAGLAGSLVLVTFAHSVVWLMALMALMALMRSPIAPLADSLIARMALRHTLSYGRMRLWGSFSFALAALGSGALWQAVGFEWMFFCAGILILPVCWCALLLEEGAPPEPLARQPAAPLTLEPGVVVILAATFLVGGALGMSGLFEGVAIKQLGGGELMVGALFAVMAFSQLPTMWYGDQILRRLDGATALLLSYGLQACAYAGYALASRPWQMLLASCLSGLGFGLFFIATVQLLDARAPAGHSATLQGIMNAGAWGLAPLISSPVSGFLYDTFGTASVFFASCGLNMLAMLLLWSALQLGVLRQTRPHMPAAH